MLSAKNLQKENKLSYTAEGYRMVSAVHLPFVVDITSFFVKLAVL